MDNLSKEHRSWNMSGISGKNTKPEKLLRSLLHRAGFRFKLHDNNLPGKPDIILPKYNTVIFVHGCFWHRHQGCKYAYTPKSRVDFWNQKFKQTIERDQKNSGLLQRAGWHVVTAWECELKKPEIVVNLIISFLHSLKQEAA